MYGEKVEVSADVNVYGNMNANEIKYKIEICRGGVTPPVQEIAVRQGYIQITEDRRVRITERFDNGFDTDVVVTIRIDPENVIGELNEGNNVITKGFDIRESMDLRPVALTGAGDIGDILAQYGVRTVNVGNGLGYDVWIYNWESIKYQGPRYGGLIGGYYYFDDIPEGEVTD